MARKDPSKLNETTHDGMDPAGPISVPSIFDLPSAEELDGSLAHTGLLPLVVASGPPNIGGRCQDCRVKGCEDARNRPSQLFGRGTCPTHVRVDGPPCAVKGCRSYASNVVTQPFCASGQQQR